MEGIQEHLLVTAGPKVMKCVLVLLVWGLCGAVSAARPPQDLAPSLHSAGELVLLKVGAYFRNAGVCCPRTMETCCGGGAPDTTSFLLSW